jgi:hypothetical protein
MNTVSKSISNKLPNQEKRRQENIFELIYTEKDFVDDLIYVEEVCCVILSALSIPYSLTLLLYVLFSQNWIQPLLSDECIPDDKSEQFVNDLFWNLPEIRKSNTLLLQDLLQRQLQSKVVHEIGDVFLKHVSTIFEPFVKYGAHQIISKYIFETEKLTNPAFAKLVEVPSI